MQLAARRACSKTSDLRSSDGSCGRVLPDVSCAEPKAKWDRAGGGSLPLGKKSRKHGRRPPTGFIPMRIGSRRCPIKPLPKWQCCSGGIRVDREKLPSGDGEVWFCDPALLPAGAGAAVLRRAGRPFPLRSLPNLCKQCPAGALKGTLRQLGAHRSEIVDIEKCYRKQVETLTAQISRQEGLCRKCFAVCPIRSGICAKRTKNRSFYGNAAALRLSGYAG